MKMRFFILAVCLAGLLVVAHSARSDDIRYMGRIVGANAGRAQVSGKNVDLLPGTSIPGWGTVTEITDTHLLLQRELTDRDRGELRRQGAADYEILEITIPREDLRSPILRPVSPDGGSKP